MPIYPRTFNLSALSNFKAHLYSLPEPGSVMVPPEYSEPSFFNPLIMVKPLMGFPLSASGLLLYLSSFLLVKILITLPYIFPLSSVISTIDLGLPVSSSMVFHLPVTVCACNPNEAMTDSAKTIITFFIRYFLFYCYYYKNFFFWLYKSQHLVQILNVKSYSLSKYKSL